MHSIITLLICNAAYCSPCFAIQSLVLHYFCFLHKNSKEIFQFILCSVSFLWFSKAVWIWFFFSVPHRSLRQILLSLPPILDMLFLLLFVILIFAMLGKLMIMRVIVLLFIQNISKLIVCLHLWCSCLQIKCAFSPAGRIRFFLWKSVSHLSSAFSSFCVFGDGDFFQKEWFSLITSWRMPSHFLGKPPRLMIVLCRNFHVIWRPAKRRLQNCN